MDAHAQNRLLRKDRSMERWPVAVVRSYTHSWRRISCLLDTRSPEERHTRPTAHSAIMSFDVLAVRVCEYVPFLCPHVLQTKSPTDLSTITRRRAPGSEQRIGPAECISLKDISSRRRRVASHEAKYVRVRRLCTGMGKCTK